MAVPVLNVSGINILEGTGRYRTATFQITLDTAATSPITLNYYLQPGSASSILGDYVEESGAITISAGSTSQTITLDIYGDSLDEANEAFQLILTGVKGATFAGGAAALSATATILDDDGGAATGVDSLGAAAVGIAGPVSASTTLPTLTVFNVSQIEGDSGGQSVRFLVTLDRAPTVPVTVNYYLQDGSASGLQGDFIGTYETLTIQAGQRSAWITTTVRSDAAIEGDETFHLVMTGVQGAVFVGNAAALDATATIIDNDGSSSGAVGGVGEMAHAIAGPASVSDSLPTLAVHDVSQIEGDAGAGQADRRGVRGQRSGANRHRHHPR